MGDFASFSDRTLEPEASLAPAAPGPRQPSPPAGRGLVARSGLRPSQVPLPAVPAGEVLAADDPREREVDAVARQVTGLRGGIPGLGAPRAGETAADRAPLPDRLRAALEPRLGADLGGVRLHTGARADQLSRELDADAFTTGGDVFFRRGSYDPATPAGQRLLAHELAHAVQQGAARRTGAGPALRAVTCGVIQRQLRFQKRAKDKKDKQIMKDFYVDTREPEPKSVFKKKAEAGLPPAQDAKAPSGRYVDGRNMVWDYHQGTQQFKNAQNDKLFWDPETRNFLEKLTPDPYILRYLPDDEKTRVVYYSKRVRKGYLYGDGHKYHARATNAAWFDVKGRPVGPAGQALDSEGHAQKRYVLGQQESGHYLLPVKKSGDTAFTAGLPNLFGGAADVQDLFQGSPDVDEPNPERTTLDREMGEESGFKYQIKPDTDPQYRSEVTMGQDRMTFYSAAIAQSASPGQRKTAHQQAHGEVREEMDVNNPFEFHPAEIDISEETDEGTREKTNEEIREQILTLFQSRVLSKGGRSLQNPEFAARRGEEGKIDSALSQFRGAESTKFLVERVRADRKDYDRGLAAKRDGTFSAEGEVLSYIVAGRDYDNGLNAKKARDFKSDGALPGYLAAGRDYDKGVADKKANQPFDKSNPSPGYAAGYNSPPAEEKE